MNYKSENLILLSKSAHRGMIMSVVELIKEPTGYLIGAREEDGNHIFSTYPVQTAIRRPTSVEYGNKNAIERLRKLEEVWNNHSEYLGGFHAHLGRKEEGLSKGDINFILEEMETMKRDEWIELILLFQSREHSYSYEIGEQIRNQKKNLVSTIHDESKHSYLIEFTGYSINKKGKTRKLTIRDEKIEIVRKGFKE